MKPSVVALLLTVAPFAALAQTMYKCVEGGVTTYVHPEAPDRLRQALTEADPPIPDGFMVVPRGLEGLKRFVASGPGWKLAFDREQIERKAIRFDPASRTLTICELPPDVLQALNNEFSTQETDDSA